MEIINFNCKYLHICFLTPDRKGMCLSICLPCTAEQRAWNKLGAQEMFGEWMT